MRTDAAAPTVKHLADYAPPDYEVETVRLVFALDPRETVVTAILSLRRREGAADDAPLVLDGEKLSLREVAIDGRNLGADQYEVSDSTLVIASVPAAFSLTTVVAIDPQANTALSGLYLSSGMFCTQCEAQGFRRITYYPDRPDVLSRFSVRIEAPKSVPVLLSNGNPGASGDLPGGRHFAEWDDPHPKPAYLFALVGGDLASLDDRFVTMSGREVTLRIFVHEKDLGRCAYALDALKRAMRWDEEVFGRQYDLDLFMIVAVDHFNFGAMENKGLNIFNAACVLASPETATDMDYETIEAIVAHEYFHNWSGNRVTCRDWFQLCLKEGFTVFRDQEFSADQRDRAVQRIKDVRRLWARQFPEDAGPLAHPVRPSSYVAIDNFYTATVYDKGAELVRMMKALVGAEAFRAGTDRYFEKNDGTAATVEDFVGAIEAASGRDLSRFMAWYAEAGTPVLRVEESREASGNGVTHTLTLTAEAGNRPVPVRLALIDEDGEAASERLVEVEGHANVVTEGVTPGAVASVLRGFSAPVRVERNLSVDERLKLARADTDPFSRWQAGYALAVDAALSLGGLGDLESPELVADELGAAIAKSVENEAFAPAFRAEVLRLPSLTDLARASRVIDPEKLQLGREVLRSRVLSYCRPVLESLHDGLASDEPYDPGALQAGRRALRNEALRLLLADADEAPARRALRQAEEADNMTDEAAATAALAHAPVAEREAALARFYDRWKDDALVLNKWFAWQAAYTGPGALEEVRALTEHPAFDKGNPNKVRALIGVFAMENLPTFHAADGSGYDFFFDFVSELDGRNPQVASRLLTATESWRRLEPLRRDLIEKKLRSLAERKGLSDNLYETAQRLVS
ncbi:aminopeptidase N [Parvularcula dongshanensis]|uniref:Aminopeptidase N n=1 Tax=Parvularcula dongshanensis TaxID=1173995 RepID=A0A840I2J5_9PROT|nr:aminopeptidase N [Parvularcula dongshanensis]MBB4658555.1 aminopeptidase N [Parvularcula dongshanensis]